MKVIFAGTPPFAATALEAICTAGYDISLVLTQPDRPAGRGKALSASAVKQLAQTRGIAVFQPPTLKEAHAQQVIRDQQADVMVVAAYGLILPQAVLDMPRFACLNIHGSLLPRWRGAAPIHRAIQAGDTQTGITIMRMEAGLDTGPMLAKQTIDITADATTASLHDELASLGAQMLVAVLDQIDKSAGRLPLAQAQPSQGVTYASKIEKSESLIDWRQPAAAIERTVRAFDPFPGTTMRFSQKPEEVLKVWRTRLVDQRAKLNLTASVDGSPGRVHVDWSTRQLFVAGGDAWLEILVVQKPGGKRIPVATWLLGYSSNPSPWQEEYALNE